MALNGKARRRERRWLVIGCWLVTLSAFVSAVDADERVRLFLGPPSENVFARTSGSYADTYDDLRNAYREHPELQASVELVDRSDLADLALMVTFRGKVGLLGPKNQLNARLFVLGTDYSTDLDGTEGIAWGSFSNQAKSLLRQTAEWATANRNKLPRFSGGRTTPSIGPNPTPGPTLGGLFLPSAPDQTAGVLLRHREISRQSGAKGTQIRYLIETGGFPADKTYTITVATTNSESGTMSGVKADGAGALREGRFFGKKVDFAELRLTVAGLMRGDAHTIRVESTDGQVTAATTVIPFPIHATCGPCLIWAEAANEAYTRFDVHGLGFPPGTEVSLIERANDTTSESLVFVDAHGQFVRTFDHAGDGQAFLDVQSSSCALTIQYSFGAPGRAIQ